MIRVESYICDKWVSSGNNGQEFFNPSNVELLGTYDSSALNMADIIAHARQIGGANLRKITFYQRAMILKALASYLNENRQILYPASLLTGATKTDGLIDIDGGISTLFVYASKGRRQLPDAVVMTDGALEKLSRDNNFVGQHIMTPRQGVAIHINAFNFPIWGMLEKFAPAFLAGMPVIVKPASVTCHLTEICVRLMIQSDILPKGALQLISGNIGNLLDHTQSQDVIGFTGSAVTASKLKIHPNILERNVRFLAEQDSLNASVLGLDAKPDSVEFAQMIREATRELTVKAGQKCTAMRRLLIPEQYVDVFTDSLKAKLEGVTIGDPHDENVKMGPLVSKAQQRDVMQVIKTLSAEAQNISHDNTPANISDIDNAKGAFVSPTLLYCNKPDDAKLLHEMEAFGPVATIMPYRDTAHAARLANLGDGSLVVSMFTQNTEIASEFALAVASYHGRIYFANGITGKQATGHGSPLPHLVHGGPGRAGGGEELGGLRGMNHYLQRTAIQGNPDIVSAVSKKWAVGSAQNTESRHPFRLYLEELTLGKSYLSKTRLITMPDVEHFAEFSGDKFYAHLDEEAAKANPFFEGKVVHGYLLLSFAAGLFVDPVPGPVLANYGIDNLRFTQPVYPGQSIRVSLTVMTIDERGAKDGIEYGEVRWYVSIINQDDEEIASYELLTMNQKKRVNHDG
ncbi:MAG: phenylacetic acid degradation bifunctional protein PaaZ [Alphaproteobacteria bacterium]|nr:phenylacetic acid degradation bifunctional protein PaaZ [Alphaproteobacteria bacterium]